MSLFKILRGDSSRISKDTTPFHDGYAYFTPDDGGFYIDALSNGEEKRVRIGASDDLTGTLVAGGWENKQQTIAFAKVKADSNGLASVAQGASEEQVEAVFAAGIYAVSQTDGFVTFTYTGEEPQIDIPITIILLG